MSAPVEREAPAGSSALAQLAVPLGTAVMPVSLDPDLEAGTQLPGDHPAWTRDRLSVSFKAREIR